MMDVLDITNLHVCVRGQHGPLLGCECDVLSCVKCPEDDIWKRTVLANQSGLLLTGETLTHPKGFYFTRTQKTPPGTVERYRKGALY